MPTYSFQEKKNSIRTSDFHLTSIAGKVDFLSFYLGEVKGAFNNYVDKMRGRGGQEMFSFVHSQDIKSVNKRGVHLWNIQ